MPTLILDEPKKDPRLVLDEPKEPRFGSGLYPEFPDLPDFEFSEEHRERMQNSLYYTAQYGIPPEMAFDMEPELTKEREKLDLLSDIEKAIKETPENIKIGTIGLAASIMFAIKRRGMMLSGGGIFSDEMVKHQFEPIKPMKREELPNIPGMIRPTIKDWPTGVLGEAFGLVTRLPHVAGIILQEKQRKLAEEQDRMLLQKAPITKALRKVTQSGVPSMIAAIGIGILTGDVITSLALLGEMEGGSAFQTQLESGASIMKANVIADLSEAAEIGGEMLVLPKIFKGVKEGFSLRQAFTTILENTTQEGITGFNQRFLEVFGIETTKGVSYEKAAIKALNEGINAVPENAWVGGATAGGAVMIRGGFDMAVTAKEAITAKKPTKPIAKPKEVIEKPAETLKPPISVPEAGREPAAKPAVETGQETERAEPITPVEGEVVDRAKALSAKEIQKQRIDGDISNSEAIQLLEIKREQTPDTKENQQVLSGIRLELQAARQAQRTPAPLAKPITPEAEAKQLYHYTDVEIKGNVLKAGQPHEQNYFGDGIYLTEKDRFPGKYEYPAELPKDLKILDLTSEKAYEDFRDKVVEKIGLPVYRSGQSLYDDFRYTAVNSENESQTNKAIRKAVAELTEDYDAIKSPYFGATEKDKSFEMIIKRESIAKQVPAKPVEKKAKSKKEKIEKPERKVSRLAKRTEELAVEKQLTESLGELPTYETMKMADQARMATEEITKDYEQAKQMALGKKAPPKGLRGASIYEAVKYKAVKEGDVETLRQLATESTIPTKLSALGQEIKAADTRTALADPVKAMQDIKKKKEAVVKKRKKITSIKRETSRMTKEMKSAIMETTTRRQNWSEFVESIRC